MKKQSLSSLTSPLGGRTDMKARKMRTLTVYLSLLTVVVVGSLAGCSKASTKIVDVSDSIRASLDQAGLKDVSVSQDRENGVVTLSGNVAAEVDKSQAESLAKSMAGTQVVSNQIMVLAAPEQPAQEQPQEKNNPAKKRRKAKHANAVHWRRG